MNKEMNQMIEMYIQIIVIDCLDSCIFEYVSCDACIADVYIDASIHDASIYMYRTCIDASYDAYRDADDASIDASIASSYDASYDDL